MNETCESWEDFLSEWGMPDDLNMAVCLFIDPDTKSAQVTFAQPRKLRMTEVSIEVVDVATVRRWYEKNAADCRKNVITC